MEGFWLIDKPVGWTSFDVCAKLRRILNIKKIGHSGTLDPFATGLLVVASGKCTRLLSFLEKARKTYVTEIIFGKTSVTLDPDSEIVSCHPELVSGSLSQKKIQELLAKKFSGKILQIPPQFSALKRGGEKACDLARRGEKVDLAPRETEIFSTKILSYDFPKIELEIEVAAGFYVRAFARDLGEAMGSCALCHSLRRTRVGDLSVDDAEALDHLTMPIDPKFVLHLPQCEIPTGRVQDFVGGRAFPWGGLNGEMMLVRVGENTIGVGEVVHGSLQPRVVL